MSDFDAYIVIPKLTAEIEKLRAERENLLALLKAAREHREWCNGDSVTRDLGPPLERCKEIETP